jgi:hypothetical protein
MHCPDQAELDEIAPEVDFGVLPRHRASGALGARCSWCCLRSWLQVIQSRRPVALEIRRYGRRRFPTPGGRGVDERVAVEIRRYGCRRARRSGCSGCWRGVPARSVAVGAREGKVRRELSLMAPSRLAGLMRL